MYYQIYEALNGLFFNSLASVGSFEAQALTFMSLALSAGLAYMPFKLIIGFVNAITDWRR